MDIFFKNNIDKNNNSVSVLNLIEPHQENMEVSSFSKTEENSNCANRLLVNGINEDILNNLNAAIFDGQENDVSKAENMNLASHESSNTNHGSSNTRKSKKKKRHYNINKNKKWNKTYKRQKMINTIKTDTESISQNNRKHTYTKVPKIIFNNKQTMHRGSGLSKFFLPDKRPRDIIVPPTKFLLGGNISDPLNLNSLQDEALVSISAVTPKSSPIPTPPKIEVIIPPNIHDPLHLLDPVDSIEYEKQLVSPIKNRRLNRQRSRKKRIKKIDGNEKEHIEETEIVSNDVINFLFSPKDVDLVPEIEETTEQSENSNIEDAVSMEVKLKSNRDVSFDTNNTRKRKSSECLGFSSSVHAICSGNLTKKVRRFDSKDKIVSPVIPQPGAWKRPPKVQLGAPRNRNRTTSSSGIYCVLNFFFQRTTKFSIFSLCFRY